MNTIEFDRYLVKGLRPHANIPRNSPYMDRYQNLMACERRAKVLPAFTWPAGFPTLSTSWPPAEGYHRDRVALSVIENNFAALDVSALSNASVSLFSATAPASSYTVSGSGSWQFAAFLDSYFATNGTSLVYKAPSTASNKVVGHHAGFACKTVCNWNNRLVLGGLSGSRLSDASWTRMYNAWLRRNKKNVVTSEDDTFDAGWIVIGPRVGGDPTIPNANILALLGLPSDTAYTSVHEVQVITGIESGEYDLLPMRHVGTVLRTRVYRGDLIVYGTEGVSRVRMSEIGPVEEKICPIGLWGRASVGGEDSAVNEEGELMSLGLDGNIYMVGTGAMRYATEGVYQPENVGRECYRLGYAEYLGALQSATPADHLHVVYDPTEQRYWFSATDGSYLLTKTGLSYSLGVVPSVCFRVPGSAALLGAAKTSLTGAMLVRLRNVAFDGGRRDPFNVGRIDCTTTDTAASEADRWYITPYSKLAKHSAMTTFDPVASDVRGSVPVDQYGVEHQYEWTANDRTAVDLDGAVGFIDPPDKSPNMRKWRDKLGV